MGQRRLGPWSAFSFGGFKDKQSFTEWPNLKILDLWRQLQASCEHEFSSFSPYLSFRIFKKRMSLLILGCCLQTAREGGGHLPDYYLVAYLASPGVFLHVLKTAGCFLGDGPLSVEAGLPVFRSSRRRERGRTARSESGRSDLGGGGHSSQGGKGLFSNHQGALLYSREPFTDIWSTPKWNLLAFARKHRITRSCFSI